MARSPKVAHLGAYTSKPELRWDDFYPAARDAVTVQGEARGFPALVDNLCVAYSKKVFKDAGVPEPTAGWTWDDFTQIARQLTNPAKGIFGTGWPADGGEDCVWRIYPMIWDLGGDIVTKAGDKVGFDGDSGLKALQTINQLGKDKSVYPDTKPGSETMYQIFNNNKMGMVPTGPWQLPDFIDNKTDYGVVPLPTFSGNNVTIAGPDTWTVFDNGQARVAAAVTFLTYLTEAGQDVQWASQAGSLPLRSSTAQSPEWKAHVAKTVGLERVLRGPDVCADPAHHPHVPPDLPAHGAGDRQDAARPGLTAGRAARARADRERRACHGVIGRSWPRPPSAQPSCGMTNRWCAAGRP